MNRSNDASQWLRRSLVDTSVYDEEILLTEILMAADDDGASLRLRDLASAGQSRAAYRGAALDSYMQHVRRGLVEPAEAYELLSRLADDRTEGSEEVRARAYLWNAWLTAEEKDLRRNTGVGTPSRGTIGS